MVCAMCFSWQVLHLELLIKKALSRPKFPLWYNQFVWLELLSTVRLWQSGNNRAIVVLSSVYKWLKPEAVWALKVLNWNKVIDFVKTA